VSPVIWSPSGHPSSGHQSVSPKSVTICWLRRNFRKKIGCPGKSCPGKKKISTARECRKKSAPHRYPVRVRVRIRVGVRGKRRGKSIREKDLQKPIRDESSRTEGEESSVSSQKWVTLYHKSYQMGDPF